MGKFYLFHMAYNGRNIHGWQEQPDVDTLEGEFIKSARRIYPNGNMRCRAASRTDSGVHAFGQVVKVLIPKLEDPDFLLRKLNLELPSYMRLLEARRVWPSFKVNHLVTAKEYWYLFKKDKSGATDLPYLPKGVDFELMKNSANIFIGKKDFTHYQYRSDVKGNYIREIFESRIIKADKLFHYLPDNIWCFQVRGSGFLKQQIRIMLGALVNRGLLIHSEDEFIESFYKEGKPVGFIAPSGGLFLKHIEYPLWKNNEGESVIDQERWKLDWLSLGFVDWLEKTGGKEISPA